VDGIFPVDRVASVSFDQSSRGSAVANGGYGGDLRCIILRGKEGGKLCVI
jgi:hypothetical protein